MTHSMTICTYIHYRPLAAVLSSRLLTNSSYDQTCCKHARLDSMLAYFLTARNARRLGSQGPFLGQKFASGERARLAQKSLEPSIFAPKMLHGAPQSGQNGGKWLKKTHFLSCSALLAGFLSEPSMLAARSESQSMKKMLGSCSRLAGS